MDVEKYLEDFTRRDWQTIEGGTVRIAVVGLGDFAVNRALPAIREAAFCTPTVMISGSPRKAEGVAREFDANTVLDYEEYAEGRAVERYDAVYIATPPVFHRQFTEIAADLGKHVLCEKPLAADTANAEKMVDRCETHDVTLMTAYRLRTEPVVRRVRAMIRDGIIGDVVQFTGLFSTKLLDDMGADTWRLDPTLAGGGAMIDLGVYPLNLSRFLLERDPQSVWATTTRSGVFSEVEGHARLHLIFPADVHASCLASFNAHPDNRLQVLGTDGQILIHEPFGGDVEQDLVVERGDARTEYTGAAVNEVTEEFDYFAQCVLTGEECESDGRDGLMDLRIIEKAYESAASGSVVSVE